VDLAQVQRYEEQQAPESKAESIEPDMDKHGLGEVLYTKPVHIYSELRM